MTALAGPLEDRADIALVARVSRVRGGGRDNRRGQDKSAEQTNTAPVLGSY
jgi:hypothetical protein